MLSGTSIGDRFEIGALSASGAMGAVYRAFDRATSCHVALKVLLGADPAIADRFEREAEILATLGHPGIVRHVAHGRSDTGQLYLAMEWLDGEDLAARIARAPLSAAEAVTVSLRVAAALGAAHARGIVHRDLKPANVFLQDGRPERATLLDFGIALLRRDAPRATQAGFLLGTPGYMAPEQVRGESAIDARADVFALGCVLFELLAGRPVFEGEHVMAVLAKVLIERPARLLEIRSDLPEELDALVDRMLAKEPHARPQDGHEAEAALAAIAARMTAGAGPLAAHATARPPALTNAEQRVLSIVLLGAREAPPAQGLSEDARATIAIEDAVQIAAATHAGRLEPLADGSSLVSWAGAGAAADQAAAAAHCALRLRELVAAGVPVVVATGRGVAGERTSEIIDRAVALLKVAESGSGVVVDEVTSALLALRFEVTGDGAARTLVRALGAGEGGRKLLGRATPFVGRERELAVLEGLHAACVSEPSAQAAVVKAAAGAGKSRLRQELLARIELAAERAGEPAPTVFIGRGDPMRSSSPFGLMAQAIRNAAGVTGEQTREERRGALAAFVGARIAGEEGARVAAFLGEMAGIAMDPEEGGSLLEQLRAARQDAMLMGDQIRHALEALVVAACARRPLILVLEDLHWGDLPTVKLVDAALRRAASLPFFVIAFARPEIEAAFPRLWEERQVVELRLGELPRKAAEKLARAVLGASADDAKIAAIVEQSAGNAFFLEELIRAVASGREGTLPGSVLAMAQARLTELDPKGRRILRAASVFGQTFSSEGVTALLGGSSPLDLDETRRGLARLVDREALDRRNAGATPGESRLAFRHALLREAAYAALTDEDRRLGHRLAGAWLESSGEGEAVTIAAHFERGGEPERAVKWLSRGAEQALEGGDFANALALAQRALVGIASEAPRSMDLVLVGLHLILAEAHRWRGAFEEAERAALQAASAARPGSLPWFRAVDEVLGASLRRGNMDIGLSWAAMVSEVAEEPSARSAKVVCVCSAARLLFHAGQYADAAAMTERIRGLAEDRQTLEPRAVAEVERLFGAMARHRGDLVGDLNGYGAALTAFERAGDARNACNMQVSLGFTYIQVGDYERARGALEAAEGRAERLGLSSVATRARQNLGLVLAALGDVEAARAIEERVVAECRVQGNARFEAWTRIYLSALALAANRPVDAEREARTAADALLGTPPARAGALASLARALVAQNRLAEAERASDAALRILDELGAIEELEGLVFLAAAESALASRQSGRARTVLERACRRVHERAASIDDAALRVSFLERVPENRALLALLAEQSTSR